MNLVYEEVEVAIQEGNPPFAAIITDSKNNILAVAHNQANTKQLAIAHAEIEAIQLACKLIGKKKLDGCILYANAESCGMCSTAIIKSGISQVVYGAPHESGSNPDLHFQEVNKKATPQLRVHGGFMREKFIEQIDRGRSQTLIGEEILQTHQKKRSQEPKPPFPYLVEEVNYGNSEISLSGTLTLPRTIGPFPAVILIHGSSALDRDETILGHKPFLVLSDHFTRHGIAVLRFDKRGVGKSTGNYDNATIEDFCDDVAKGIEYLKSRPEIIRNQIGLIGHSEGGIIAPMLAVKSNDVAFIVLMAGTGVNGEEIFCEQGRLLHRGNGVDEEMIAIDTQIRKIFTGIVKKETNRDVAKEQIHEALAKFLSGLTEEQKIWVKIHSVLTEELIKRFNSPWGHFYFPYEPSTALSHITIPTLVLNGDLDLVVSPKQNLPFIDEALKKAGNKDYAIIELPKLNHAFQTCEIGSWDEYEQTEETMAPSILNIMTDWILERIVKEPDLRFTK
jgi:tRNA(Arg) A34 adenosine deaminase TadA/pimeloyl-ACP methyl ester carboxylesterase